MGTFILFNYTIRNMIRDFYIRLFLLSYTYNKNLLLQDFIIRDVDIRLTSSVVTAISTVVTVPYLRILDRYYGTNSKQDCSNTDRFYNVSCKKLESLAMILDTEQNL